MAIVQDSVVVALFGRSMHFDPLAITLYYLTFGLCDQFVFTSLTPVGRENSINKSLEKKKAWGRVSSTVVVTWEVVSLCLVYVAKMKTFACPNSSIVVAGCKERMQAHPICPHVTFTFTKPVYQVWEFRISVTKRIICVNVAKKGILELVGWVMMGLHGNTLCSWNQMKCSAV